MILHINGHQETIETDDPLNALQEHVPNLWWEELDQLIHEPNVRRFRGGNDTGVTELGAWAE